MSPFVIGVLESVVLTVVILLSFFTLNALEALPAGALGWMQTPLLVVAVWNIWQRARGRRPVPENVGPKFWAKVLVAALFAAALFVGMAWLFAFFSGKPYDRLSWEY